MNLRSTGIRRRGLAALSATLAGAVVAVGGCATVPAAGHATRSAGPARASRTAVPPLGPGRVGQRSAVPWRQVGPGWTLAEYSASTVPMASPRRTGATTLYLISPEGGRYRLYQWPAAAVSQVPGLVDWSGDGTRALLVRQGPDNAPWLVEQITLATGKVSTFRLPWYATLLGYTKPSGLNVLVSIGPNELTRIARYNLRGQRQVVLASGDNLSAIQSPDGTTLAVSGTTGLVLVSNAGGVIRRLPVPGISAPNGCYPERWWDASTILAGCFVPGSSASRLWLVPAGGGRPTVLTPQRNGHGPDPQGDIGAWQLPGGLYLQAVGACSALFIVRQDRNGPVHVVNIPGTEGNNNRILTARQGRLLVRAQTGCPGSESLLWFNPATRGVQMLLRAPGNVSGVIGAVPFRQAGG
ncbi:MAG TPA: hypothetical protein VN840_22040 [Streptosporangiaceae bacterium]|nr:hypothetical protein [Streptosporangiaceae bacterium]